jgi:hypothetical protein
MLLVSLSFSIRPRGTKFAGGHRLEETQTEPRFIAMVFDILSRGIVSDVPLAASVKNLELRIRSRWK